MNSTLGNRLNYIRQMEVRVLHQWLNRINMNSDITICPGDGCPVKEHCVRFLTPPDDHLQAYFFKPPGKRNEEGKWECEMFWGQPQERIMKQLNDILNGTDDSN